MSFIGVRVVNSGDYLNFMGGGGGEYISWN